MNINTKKFKAITISFVFLLLILGAAFVFIGKYFIQFDAGDVALENAGQEIIRNEKMIDNYLTNGMKILQTVGNQKFINMYVKKLDHPDLINDVSEVFKVVIDTNPHIVQISHIDKRGNEGIRVLRNVPPSHNIITAHSTSKISDKKMEGYFHKSKKVQTPFYSAFGAEYENGTIKSITIDASLPLYFYDEHGTIDYRGVLIIRFDASALFKVFSDSQLYKYVLFDNEGLTMYHHNKEFAWGKYNTHKHNIRNDFAGGESILRSNGLVLHKTFTTKVLDLSHHVDGGIGMALQLSSSYNKQLSEKDFNYIVLYVLTFLLVFVIPGIIINKYWGIVSTLEETKEYNSWLQQKQEQLQQEVYKDALTGIYNIKKFDSVFTSLAMDFVNFDKPFSMIVFDIDSFRRINDDYSYQIADNIIRTVADAISFISRDSYTFSRYGGVKFVILLPNTRLRNAVVFAEKIKTHIAKMDNLVGEEHITVTLSVGVDSYEKGDTKGVFFERVQNYTEEAIDTGGDKVVFDIEKQNILNDD